MPTAPGAWLIRFMPLLLFSGHPGISFPQNKQNILGNRFDVVESFATLSRVFAFSLRKNVAAHCGQHQAPLRHGTRKPAHLWRWRAQAVSAERRRLSRNSRDWWRK